MLPAFAVEIAMMLLLGIAILYCHRLDRQLRILRSGRESMLDAARQLAGATGEARAMLAAIEKRAQIIKVEQGEEAERKLRRRTN